MDQSSMEKLVLRNEAYIRIQNIMGRYSFLLTAAKYKEMVELFSTKPDVRAEMNWGVYDGPEGIFRLYAKYHNDVVVGPGTMAVHALSTPVIEVSGDLRTAKAVFVSPGHITGGPFSPDKTIKAHWAWMKYGVDFIYENTEWKIWHLHVYGIFMAPFDKSWAETGDIHAAPEMPEDYRPDRAPTYSWSYNVNAITELVPAPPLPYYTFNPADAY